VAAQLGADPTLQVHRQRGGFGELRVVVDGKDVVDASRLTYPTPGAVVRKVRTHLESLVAP